MIRGFVQTLCQAVAITVHTLLEVETLEGDPLLKMTLYKIILLWTCDGWVMLATGLGMMSI